MTRKWPKKSQFGNVGDPLEGWRTMTNKLTRSSTLIARANKLTVTQHHERKRKKEHPALLAVTVINWDSLANENQFLAAFSKCTIKLRVPLIESVPTPRRFISRVTNNRLRILACSCGLWPLRHLLHHLSPRLPTITPIFPFPKSKRHYIQRKREWLVC